MSSPQEQRKPAASRWGTSPARTNGCTNDFPHLLQESRVDVVDWPGAVWPSGPGVGMSGVPGTSPAGPPVAAGGSVVVVVSSGSGKISDCSMASLFGGKAPAFLNASL